MSLRSLLNSSCTIRRPTAATSGTSGFAAHTYADNATGVACTVQAMSSHEARSIGRETGSTLVTIYLPYGTDIKTQDRVILTAGPCFDTYASKPIAIIGPPQDEVGRRSHLRVPGEVLEGGGRA